MKFRSHDVAWPAAVACAIASFALPACAATVNDGPSTAQTPSVAEYAGTYKLAPFDVVVTSTNGKLFAAPTGNPNLELTPVSPDRFSVPSVGAEISFSRDANSKVNSLTLAQRGKNVSGPKVP